MARPTIDHLLDQTVRVWRPTVTKSDLGVEETSYSIVASLSAAVNRAVDPVADVGAGLAPVGRRRFYFRPDVDLQERDVLEITAGSEAPGKWEVDQPPSRPRSHHTQIDSVAWHGKLPTSSARASGGIVATASLGGAGVKEENPIPEPTIHLGSIDVRPATVLEGVGLGGVFQATGGVITEVGGYRIHTFVASGNFTIVDGPVRSDIEYLVVAGGGAGGGGFNGYPSGGGGAGGVRTGVFGPMATGVFPVVVGAGGVNTGQSIGPSGSNSSVNGIVATGGGGGGAGGIAGAAGGSGGGGNGGSPSSNGGAGTAGQGFAGGNGASNSYAGGGGGASAVGSGGTTINTNSNGGAGVVSSISGVATTYGGGGGGANNSNDGTRGLGGAGGGGKWYVQAANGGVVNPAPATADGTANTGGGGGGRTTPNSGLNRGGSGGSGIVIIRYPIST